MDSRSFDAPTNDQHYIAIVSLSSAAHFRKKEYKRK